MLGHSHASCPNSACIVRCRQRQCVCTPELKEAKECGISEVGQLILRPLHSGTEPHNKPVFGNLTANVNADDYVVLTKGPCHRGMRIVLLSFANLNALSWHD